MIKLVLLHKQVDNVKSNRKLIWAPKIQLSNHQTHESTFTGKSWWRLKQQIKITKSIQQQKQLKTYSQKLQQYQKYTWKNLSRVAPSTTFTADRWLDSMATWYHQIKSMTNIELQSQATFVAEYCGMIFIYHTRSIIKTMNMHSCQNNRKFIRQKVWFASTSKIAISFVIPKEWPYQIFAWYLHSSTKITNWNHEKHWSRLQAVFW